MENEQDDRRIHWIESRIYAAMKHLKLEKFKKAFRSEENMKILNDFFLSAEFKCLLVVGDEVSLYTIMPNVLPCGKSLYFLKTNKLEIMEDCNMEEEIVAGELSKEPLVHLEKSIQHVYMPLIGNRSNQEGWGDVASKDVMDRLHSFLASVSITLGQTMGETCLPLPITETTASSGKDKIHLLESAVITWTKQIKNVLKLEPEFLLQHGNNPTPNEEIEFWGAKSANLNSIFHQLQSDRIRKVLRHLDQSKSTYCSPFAKLCKEVFTARTEANDNLRYLQTLGPWCHKLVTPGYDFPGLVHLFKPLLHTILMIWKNSQFYNTPTRIVVLMREICNALINQSCEFISGNQIFELIESGDASAAVTKLKLALKVCGTFKSTYFDYKSTANIECPENPWRIQNNALFIRLDMFLERCHDILDLTQTIVQFSMLAQIEIGGTKGKAFTTSVIQIYSDFMSAVQMFQNVDYDIMEINAKAFDDDFYDFRCKIKELERRLGSVLTQAFDDASTISSRFKLLDSFECLLDRPIIQDELEKKHVCLIQAYLDDLTSVQEAFLLAKEDPPISSNMPRVAGTVAWTRGLMDRITGPMEKLKSLHRSVMEREETKEVVKLHQSLMEALGNFIIEVVGLWGLGVDETAAAKLKLPLLRYRLQSNHPEELLAHQQQVKEAGGFSFELLDVNFDPELTCLLREVKYFLLLGLDIPQCALDLYKKEKMLRNWSGKLQLCINKYNSMMTSMLPVESPLVRTEVERIHAVVETGLEMLTWKSHGIDSFIEKTEMAVSKAETLLTALKSNLLEIEEILDSWSESPMMERQSKPELVKEYNQLHNTRISAKYQQIVEGGKNIHRLIRESNKTINTSTGHPDWKAYVEFVNGVLVRGLTKTVQVSLEWLNNQVDPVLIEAKDRPPLLQVSVNLHNNLVCYIPSVLDDERNGIRAALRGWIEDILKIGTLIKRLDLGEGTYVDELQGSQDTQQLSDTIFANVLMTQMKCKDFKLQYDKYSFLWTTDLQTMFSNFIDQVTSVNDTGLRKINLTRFHDEMNRLNEIKEEVGGLKTPTNIGWLLVDLTPIKENIVYWVQKWLHLYTGFLRDDVVSKLQTLRVFMIETRRGLAREVVPGDTDTLMKVMGHIRDVRCRMDDTIEMLAPLKDTVNLLKLHRVEIEDEILYGPDDANESEESSETLVTFLDTAGMKWDSLVNYTFRVKELIMPLQNQEVDLINANLLKFNKSVEDFRVTFKNEKKGAPFSFQGSTDEAYSLIDKFSSLYEDKQSKSVEFNQLEELFELPNTKYRTLIETASELRILKELWDFKAIQVSTYESWNHIPWKEIKTDGLEVVNAQLGRDLKSLGMRNTICKGWGVYKDVEKGIKDMSIILPLICELHSSAMRARHWKAIAAACMVQSISWNSESFNFQSVLQLELQKREADISEHVETAVKELKIEKKLEIIESRWETLRLDFVDRFGNLAPGVEDDEEERTEAIQKGIVFIPRPSDEVVENLETDQQELQSMISMGKFVKYFKDRVTKWLHTLSDIESNLRNWLNVSRQWCSLEPIYLGSEDIRNRLPDDTKRFETIDAEFKELERRAFAESPLVVHRCTETGLSTGLTRLLSDLSKCQKSLNEYLDTKKKIFPRFYFMSNVALLDILSNGNTPKKIMPYLADCYDAICDLEFEDGSSVNPHIASAMIAKDGEMVPFSYSFDMKDNVETWLNRLTDMQVLTLKNSLRYAVDAAVNWEHEKPRQEWLFDYPAQTVLQASQVFWTEETEAALEDLENGNEDAVKNYLGVCNDRLAALIKLVEGELTPGDRCKVICLITLDVHSRDVVSKLINDKAENPASFAWQQQLRSYWKVVNPLMETDIRICDFKTKYSYEYIGNCGRLVITPLTDRCYITLTTAMRLMLGGAPAGPAGTGKTETTKDLARALALPCYVFNCSDQMNFQTLGDIFKGLSQSGAWGCFDEFNRIPIEVLSVVATQVKTVLDAVVRFSDPANRPAELRAKGGSLAETPGIPNCQVGYFDFFGDRLCLIPTTGFFITMNPGYAGRTELPENLKALFRSCAMIRPDLALICENMLMSEGFQKARVLSIKFVTLYLLCSELLSPQVHYDWGLRAVKSVLRVAGMLKRGNPQLEEEPVLMRALRDFNTPKIPQQDIEIFLRLISDLFPKYADNTPKVANEELIETAKIVCQQKQLQADPGLISKVVQFQQLLDVRHSVMLIGCAGCGKTTIWKTLQGCLNEQSKENKKVAVAEVVNPKAVTSDELYGFMTLGKDWKDGVLSIIMRGMSKNYRDLGFHRYQSSKWVVLDGDIDAVWIESMNTVMDDNKVLTLVSNERIPLSDSMRMVFEINSLKNATPATVSRAGILYINESDIGWRPFVESWVAQVEQENLRGILMGLFDKFVDPLTEFMKREKLSSIIPTYLISCIETLTSIMQAQLQVFQDLPVDLQSNLLLDQIFAYAAMWSFGSSLSALSQRMVFSQCFQTTFPNYIAVENEGCTIFDYYLDMESVSATNTKWWKLWKYKVEEYVPSATIGSKSTQTPFSSIYVETMENARLAKMMQILVGQDKAVMLVGGAGTGKSMMINNWLRETVKNDENTLSSLIAMNYYTDSKSLQKHIENSIDKRSGHRFGPAGNKKLVYFIDDLNLPFVEEYGTQNALSLLRQIMAHGTFFDRMDLGFRKEIVDVKFVAAMNPHSGSFTVSERAQRYFTTLACYMPGEEDLTSIFSSILGGHLQTFDESVENMTIPLVSATIALFNKISEKFLPSAVKFVYNWSMREYADIFQGLCRAQPNCIQTPLDISKMWVHEGSRVFGDRLVDETDSSRFNDLIYDVSKSIGLDDVDALYADKPLIFTALGEHEEYQCVENFKVLTRLMEEKLEEYNESFATMNLVLFRDAVMHVTRIMRIIQNTDGNALLIGVGGSGKKSLCKLASFINEYQVKQLHMPAEYSTQVLLDQLQELMRSTGIKGIPTCLIVTDGDIINEEILVYINYIIANGWIPDLFPKEELIAMLDSLKNELRANGLSDTPQEKINLMIRRVKQNLHVVMCFSPVNDTLRIRSRRFPGILNFSTIDWFHAWPEDALVSVATSFIQDIEFADQATRENVVYHMAAVHMEVKKASEQYLHATGRNNYVTSTSFLEFISFYNKLLHEKRTGSHEQISRLESGLQVLRQTKSKVQDLQEDLKITLANVEEKKKASDTLMEQIGSQRNDAEHKQAAAAIERKRAEKATDIAAQIQIEANRELKEAIPAMEAAAAAVDCLDKKALTELKSMSKPPAGVEEVTKACLMMIEKEFKNFKWDRAKKMMSNIEQFLSSLKQFDAENMDESLITKLEPIVSKPGFNYESMTKKSIAAANLCNWVLNIYKYNRIYVKVKPLMERLASAERDKAEAENELAEVQRVVMEVERRLGDLKSTYVRATEEKMIVEELAEQCLAKLDLANRLVNGLASENERWVLEVDKLKTQEKNLVGNVLVSSAFVGYIGGFDAKFREKLWKHEWVRDILERELPCNPIEYMDPLVLLSSDADNILMMDQGLPADRISLENGVIISSSSRWPLIIDPQEQGLKWLKQRHEGPKPQPPRIQRADSWFNRSSSSLNSQKEIKRSGAVIIQLTKSGWENRMIEAIEHGLTVLIENVGEEIDPVLEPILSRSIINRGRNKFIHFAGRELEYDDRFSLYLFTKLPNPHYKPEIHAQCTIVNFIATEKGLEDQLLVRVVQAERPDKQTEQDLLQSSFNKYRIKLRDLEDKLLHNLANAPEDILADVPLIESLEATKEEAQKINEAVEKGQIVMDEISKIRELYLPVSAEASMLYFMLTKLSSINHMYQYSLASFINFFSKSISKTPASSSDVAQRVCNLRDTLRYTVFTWVSRGLFESHKQLLLVQLTFNLMKRGELESSADWNNDVFEFLLRVPTVDSHDNPCDDWLPDTAWESIQALSRLDGFTNLPGDIVEAAPRFRDWYNHPRPEKEKLPLDWAQLDKAPFLKLAVVRCLRPDRVAEAMNHFVRNSLPDGNRYVECDSTLNSYQVLEESFVDSSPMVPLYFILSPGTDVLVDLDKLAQKNGMVKGETYHNVSMGQGQDSVAQQFLITAFQQGHWVVLANVHLMPRWLHHLEKMIDEETRPHAKFRLFLSSDPSNTIPVGILSRSIKITNQAPTGLKANLKRALCSFSRNFIEESDAKTKTIVFGLCFFHSVMTERKKFGPLGFNMMYPFSLGDLRDSTVCLTNYMDSASNAGTPWDDLKYIFGEIIYGGHIVNDFDRLLTGAYLDHIMRDELLEEMELLPFAEGTSDSFKCPQATTFDRYLEHISEGIKSDSPVAFGMHPNAEIDFRTSQSNDLFEMLVDMYSGDDQATHGDDSRASPQLIAENITNEVLDRFQDSKIDLLAAVDMIQVRGPFQNVFLQECEAMNNLLAEINRSLLELTLGFAGELTMSDSMEFLVQALYFNKIPQSWLALSWPSTRNLSSWLSDASKRIEKLQIWSTNPLDIPRITWISGLVFPTSFLTAIKQTNSQKTGTELDKQTIVTEVTKKTVAECSEMTARDGMYVYGLSMQGARWNTADGFVESSLPKEMFCVMPVMNCRALRSDYAEAGNTFHCPCYKTINRGQTYVFSAQLKSKSPSSRWILAGVALIMDVGI